MDIGDKMSMVRDTKKSNFASQYWLKLDIELIMTLYYKMHQTLLHKATAILLQNSTKVCYKLWQLFCYKMQELLQTATILLQMQKLLENALVHWLTKNPGK